MIKTISVTERQVLINLLDPLIKHFKQTQGRSLLARIYGLFTIKSKVFDPVDIILMQNTSVILSQSNSTIAFDLKGSTFNRENARSNKILKDVNFLKMCKMEKLFHLSCKQKESLLSTIKADTDFLSQLNIMDYSLLLVIESI